MINTLMSSQNNLPPGYLRENSPSPKLDYGSYSPYSSKNNVSDQNHFSKSTSNDHSPKKQKENNSNAHSHLNNFTYEEPSSFGKSINFEMNLPPPPKFSGVPLDMKAPSYLYPPFPFYFSNDPNKQENTSNDTNVQQDKSHSMKVPPQNNKEKKSDQNENNTNNNENNTKNNENNNTNNQSFFAGYPPNFMVPSGGNIQYVYAYPPGVPYDMVNKMRLDYEQYIDYLRKIILVNQMENMNNGYDREKNNLLQLEQLKTVYMQQQNVYQQRMDSLYKENLSLSASSRFLSLRNSSIGEDDSDNENSDLGISLKYDKLKKKLKNTTMMVEYLKKQNEKLLRKNESLSESNDSQSIQKLYNISKIPRNTHNNHLISYNEDAKSIVLSNDNSLDLKYNSELYNLKSLDNIKNANHLISRKIEELKKTPNSDKLSVTREILELLKKNRSTKKN